MQCWTAYCNNLFLHEKDVEDDVDFPLEQDAIVAMLQHDVSFANKYFSMYRVNVPATYRPSARRGDAESPLEYDQDRLSFVVIVGVVMMRNRSTKYFSDIMFDTLRRDYGVECKATGSDTNMNVVDIDMLRASPCKLPAVEWGSVLRIVRQADAYGRCVLETPKKDTSVVAAKALVAFRDERYMLPRDADDDALQRFYEDVVCKDDAVEMHHRCTRFVKMCDNTVDQCNRAFVEAMQAISFSDDPNIVFFKTSKMAYNMKMLLGQKFVRALLPGAQMDVLKDLQRAEVPEAQCAAAYSDITTSLSTMHVVEFKKLFGLKDVDGYGAARRVLGAAFGIAVSRKDRRKGSPGFIRIYIKHAFLRALRNTHNGDVRRGTDAVPKVCLFRSAPA